MPESSRQKNLFTENTAVENIAASSMISESFANSEGWSRKPTPGIFSQLTAPLTFCPTKGSSSSSTRVNR